MNTFLDAGFTANQDTIYAEAIEYNKRFRRRLFACEEEEKIGTEYTLTEIFTNTTESIIEIPDNAVSMDIFLVGGGGGGGAWITWGYTRGTPGLGGDCYCKLRIPLYNVTSITIKCGAGGKKATSRTEFARSATNGGNTILKTNLTEYTAAGGIGGYNSYDQTKLESYTYTNGNTSVYPDFIKKCTLQKKRDNRVQTEYGLEGSYNMGLKWVEGGYWLETENPIVYSDERSEEIISLVRATTYPTSVDLYDWGIPAFYEEGNDTFAPQGAFMNKIRLMATVGPIGSIIKNTKDSLTIANACGYGGGGFGGIYRNTDTVYGGDGNQGAVVIRWHFT